MPEEYLIVYTYHIFLVHPSVSGHLAYSQFACMKCFAAPSILSTKSHSFFRDHLRSFSSFMNTFLPLPTTSHLWNILEQEIHWLPDISGYDIRLSWKVGILKSWINVVSVGLVWALGISFLWTCPQDSDLCSVCNSQSHLCWLSTGQTSFTQLRCASSFRMDWSLWWHPAGNARSLRESHLQAASKSTFPTQPLLLVDSHVHSFICFSLSPSIHLTSTYSSLSRSW